MSDNFHQSVNGGTGANHIMLGHGDAIWFSDGKAMPPFPRTMSGGDRERRTRAPWMKSKIRIRRPVPTTGTREDGYGGGSFGAPSFGGGSYTNCSDPLSLASRRLSNYLQSLAAADQSELRNRPLLSAEQLQPGLLRQRQQRISPIPTPTTPFYHSAFFRAQHWRLAHCRQHFLEVLRRSVE